MSTSAEAATDSAQDSGVPIAAESRVRRPRPKPLEQKPWTRREDWVGRRPIAQGSGKRRPIKMSLMVDLDVEQSEWVHQESKRTGQDAITILKALVDRERAARP